MMESAQSQPRSPRSDDGGGASLFTYSTCAGILFSSLISIPPPSFPSLLILLVSIRLSFLFAPMFSFTASSFRFLVLLVSMLESKASLFDPQ
jgi:hypothetical protein